MPDLNVHQLTVADRINLAKERTEKVVDHVRAAIQMHEANAIVVYSPTLSDQISRSYAAHAFNQFQSSMHLFEIVRLCALWDGPDRDKENIPTIIELIDDVAVRTALVEQTRAHWANRTPRILNPSDDPETQALEEEIGRQHQQNWAEKQAAESEKLLSDAVTKAKSIVDSPRLVSLLNVRHKHLAHSLTSTSYERKGTVAPAKYGDERWLFEETLASVRSLYIAINGSAFMWDDARQMARRNAAALWNNCAFNVMT
jgi:hypothetical protein